MDIKACQEIYDVIIIGAGLSGLTSALHILEKENTMKIKILEETSTIGGRINQTRLGEIGAKWISEEHYHIYGLLQHLKITLHHRRVMSAICAKRCWDIDMGVLSPFVKFELSRYVYELDIRVQFYRPGHYHTHHNNELSMHKHITNRLFFQKSRAFMENLVLLFSGVHARDISYAQFMSNCYTCGGLKSLMDIYVFCPNEMFELPSSKILTAFAETLKSTEILFRRKANEIHQYKDYVEVFDSENELHKAYAVIVAIPWDCTSDIIFTPPMPTELLQMKSESSSVIKKHPMITSFIANYPDGHWRKGGYSGNFFFNEPFLLIGNEYTPNNYYGLIIHEEDFEPLVKSISLRKLADYFGEDMLSPTLYIQRTYKMSSIANMPLTTPWKRVIWSSSPTSGTCFRSCLSGAVQSGLRAAVNALLLLRPQKVVWQDIADIHHCEKMQFCDVSWFTLWSSTWNLYNIAWYSALTLGTVSVLHHWHIKVNKPS